MSTQSSLRQCIAAAALVAAAGAAHAQTVVATDSAAGTGEIYLVARPYQKTMSDGASVDMWGYRVCHNLAAVWPPAVPDGSTLEDVIGAYLTTNCEAGDPMSGSLVLTVAPGDDYLQIHLLNALPAGQAVPDLDPSTGNPLVTSTSLFAPGLQKWSGGAAGAAQSLAAQSVVDGQGRPRIWSFDTAVASGDTGVYEWQIDAPGTYLVQSGTHIQVQQQMGLSLVVVKDQAAGEAYPAHTYDDAGVLIFSEVDPALHAAVAEALDGDAEAGAYGDAATGPTSTEDYIPRYFLINGVSADAGVPYDIATTVTATQSLLLRMVNAGIENRSPQLLGGYFDVIAQDAHLAPSIRTQHTALLAAAKTLDVVFSPESAGTYRLFDRALGLMNNAELNGGMRAEIVIP